MNYLPCGWSGFYPMLFVSISKPNSFFIPWHPTTCTELGLSPVSPSSSPLPSSSCFQERYLHPGLLLLCSLSNLLLLNQVHCVSPKLYLPHLFTQVPSFLSFSSRFPVLIQMFYSSAKFSVPHPSPLFLTQVLCSSPKSSVPHTSPLFITNPLLNIQTLCSSSKSSVP